MRTMARKSSKTLNGKPHGAAPAKMDEAALIALIRQGIDQHSKKDYDSARRTYQQLLKHLPNDPKILNLLGKVELDSGNFEAAKVRFDNIQELGIKNDPDILHNIALIKMKEGRFQDAAKDFLSSARHSNNPKSLLNAATCLLKLGPNTDAEEILTRLIQDNPSPEAYIELAKTRIHKRQISEAKALLTKGIKKFPGNPGMLAEIGACFYHENNFTEAISYMYSASTIDPDNTYFRDSLFLCLATVRFDTYNEKLEKLTLDFLKGNNYDHSRIGTSWVTSVLNNPNFAFLADTNSPKSLIRVDSIKNALLSELFLIGLKRSCIYDNTIEVFLTETRKAFCEIYAQGDPDKQLKDYKLLLAAMVQQNFLNEYVWDVSAPEKETLARLEDKLSRGNILIEDALIWCLYHQLTSMPHYKKAAHLFREEEDPVFEEILKTQVEEIEREKRIRKTIQSFGNIKDDTSQKVQEMYEENPYPRWQVLSKHTQSETFSGIPLSMLNAKKPLEVLIAGCGTGRHGLEIAAICPGIKISAIDLSRASLAYAIRKAEENNIRNIEYYHGDILNLPDWGKTFDVIESAGVLHHMKDPEKGLQALKKVSRPHTTYKIALYSEYARQAVVAARNIIEKNSFPSTAEGIRACRKYIRDNHERRPELDPLFKSTDFYSTSMCRDLIFHVQEHRFTLLQMKALFDANDMGFGGFIYRFPKTPLQYKEMFPEDERMLNLENWHEYEKKHPDTFIGMYQFYLYNKR